MGTETSILAEIEALKAGDLGTQDLYREVCTVLFFRYGITPTANKLYQYVRKGSMSAPAEALAKFWEDLREKSRVRIEHPDLPDEVRSAAGELVAALWIKAQEAAQEGLAILRSEVQEAVFAAQTIQAAAENERNAALRELDRAQQETQAATDRVLQLERDLAAERASKQALAALVETTNKQQTALESALVEARRDFTVELDKHRKALERSEERYEAAEKRALLEIERERTDAATLQKELGQGRRHLQEAEDRHRSTVTRLQADLGDARQKIGVGEGILQETRTQYQQQAEELQALRGIIVESEARNSFLECDITARRERIVELEGELQQWRSVPATEKAVSKQRKRTSKPPI